MTNFFHRIFGAGWGEPPPGWAAFFSARQYARFMTLVGNYFREKGTPFTLEEGAIRVGSDGEQEQRQLGLLNLAQKCHLNKEQHWAHIIADHFRTVERSQREGEALEERLENFDKVSELLAV